MIVLDTNVLSEMMRRRTDPRVAAWLGRQPAVRLFTTTITEAEIRYGIALLPSGRRREGLAAAADRLFGDLLGERILPFDRSAAVHYARFAADRRFAGRPLAMADGQIAAIVASRDGALATRNVRDFEGLEVRLIDPWSGDA